MISEQAHLAQVTTDKAAVFVETHLEKQVLGKAEAFERMAARVGAMGRFDEGFWRPDAVNYVDDFAEVQAVEWINRDLSIEEIEPLAGNEKAIGLDLTFEGRRRSAVGEAVSGRTAMSEQIKFVQGGRGYLLYAPVMRNGEFDGMVAGVCNIDRLMETLPGSVLDQYVIEIYEGDGLIYGGQGETGIWADSATTLYGNDWRVEVSPTVETLKSWQTGLPGIVLVLSLLMSGATFLGLVQWGRARRLVAQDGETKRFLESLSDMSVGMTYVFDCTTRELTYLNRFAREFLGSCIEGDCTLCQLIFEDDQSSLRAGLESLGALGRDELVELDMRWRNFDGEYRWLHHRISVLERGADGRPLLAVGVAFDVSDRIEAENAAKQNRETLDRIIDSAAIGMALVAPDGKWLRANRSLCEFLGYSEEELLTGDFQEITFPEDLEGDLEKVGEVLDGKISTYQMEKRYIRKDGEVVWALLSVSLSRDANGKPVCFISQVQDIHEQKMQRIEQDKLHREVTAQREELASMNQQLVNMAMKDGLTGISNRRHFDIALSDRFFSAVVEGKSIGVILMDVDKFKKFNDDFGHAIGDEVLKMVGRVLQEGCRDGDFVARYGGEEFVVLFEFKSESGAIEFANRLRETIASTSAAGHSVTASFGVAWLDERIRSMDELLEEADAALYLAKDRGRNCVVSAVERRMDEAA